MMLYTNRALFNTVSVQPCQTCLFSFLRYDKPKHRELPGPGDVHTARVFGTGQVKRLTELATINLSVGSPSFLGATALPLENVGGIKPAFQVAAAEFALVVCFVAGALTGLLDLDLVIGKLRDLC